MEKSNSRLSQRQVAYALTSFLLGVWTWKKVNAVSGPLFEPVIAACTNPDIPLEDFASTTGYHVYDPRVGLKVFDLLVCIITQFLLELRETYPAGILTWGAIVVVTMPLSILTTAEGGRAGARGPIRYSVIMGLLFQLFGISVIFPMIWLPSFVFGEGKRGSPLTLFRVVMAALFTLPSLILTVTVFVAPTESQLWTTAAGMLGGPILAMFGLVLFRDGSSELAPTEENAKTSSAVIRNTNKMMMVLGFVGWYTLVAIAYRSYGTSIGNLWNDIWVNAGPSVAFMTIDAGVLYLAILMFIAYRHGESKAAKALFLTTILGPATAICFVFIEMENEIELKFAASFPDDKKKD